MYENKRTTRLITLMAVLLAVLSFWCCIHVVAIRSSQKPVVVTTYDSFSETTEKFVEPEKTEKIEVKPLSLKDENCYSYTEKEVIMIAQTVYGEAFVTGSDMEMAAVVWCILNRVDDTAFPDNIADVVTQPNQFHGYNANNPVNERVLGIVDDVLERWNRERNGDKDVGRILPEGYLYFEGDGLHNYYRLREFDTESYTWYLPNPYES